MTLKGGSRTITEGDLVQFSALTGDWHPQHADAEWAASSRFGERIAHGMLVLSYAVGLLGFDPERVVALRGIDSLTFKRPVTIGQTIRADAEVAATTPLDDAHDLVTLRLRVLAADKLVLRANVQVVHRSPASTNGTDPRNEEQGTSNDLYAEQVLL